MGHIKRKRLGENISLLEVPTESPRAYGTVCFADPSERPGRVSVLGGCGRRNVPDTGMHTPKLGITDG